jgi:hypothetical protein
LVSLAKKNYCLFSRYRTLSLERKQKFRLSRGGVAGVGRNMYRRYLSRLKGYRFEILATLRQLGWIEAPHTQNFEILKSLEQTQE